VRRTDSPHGAKGLCKKCYLKKVRGGKNPNRKVRPYGQRHKQEQDDTPVSSAVHDYKCLFPECGFVFKSVFEKLDAVCPECGRIDVEELG